MHFILVALVPKTSSHDNMCIILFCTLHYAASSCEQDVSVSRHSKSLLTLGLLHLCSSPKYFNYLSPFARKANVYYIPLDNPYNCGAHNLQTAVNW